MNNHIIIAGYGIVGRAVGESLAAKKSDFCVIELNPATVTRLENCHMHVIKGDARSEATLREAGIDRAAALALAMPDEQQALEALAVAHRLRPDLKIIVRCTFSSAGLQANRLGAAGVVVAEQSVARDFAQLLQKHLPGSGA